MGPAAAPFLQPWKSGGAYPLTGRGRLECYPSNGWGKVGAKLIEWVEVGLHGVCRDQVEPGELFLWSGPEHSFDCYSSSELAPNPWPPNRDFSCNLREKDSLDPHPHSGKRGISLETKPNSPGALSPVGVGGRSPDSTRNQLFPDGISTAEMDRQMDRQTGG